MSEMKQIKKHNSGILLAMPFFVVMAILTVVSFIIPLRPTQSSMEKRDLAKFPEFSVSSLADGSYFSDISLWFSDTFPGREDWLMLSSSISTLHGYSDIAIEGDLTLGEEIPVEIPSVQTPISDSVEQMEVPEDVPAETESAGWGGVDVEGQEISQTAVIQIGDTAFNSLGFSQSASDIYIRNLNTLAQTLEGTGVRVVNAPAPTAIGIMVEPEYLEQMRCARQDEMLSYLHSGMHEDIVKVDTVSALTEHNDEYLFFRTDHHWTTLGAFYGANALLESLRKEALKAEDFTVETASDSFCGTLYSQSGVHWVTPDTLEFWVEEDGLQVTSWRTGKEEAAPLYERSYLEVKDKYSAFLGGNQPLCVIKNENVTDGSKLLLVRDSYGDSLAPFLAQRFEEVHLVDLRYYRFPVSVYAAENEIDDIAVVYSVQNFIADANLVLLTQ